jgi:hydroxymethylpyrimidine pyrophosphatase-like HAD family hydrolase
MAKYELIRPLILALDLDETFLEGDAQAKQDLQDLLDSNKEQIRLVYTSHGTAEELIGLAAKAELPVPDVFLSDSGTTALKGDGSGTIDQLQRNIVQLWPGKAAVTRLVDKVEGATLLEDDSPCRQAVQYDTEEALEALRQGADDIGCHLVLRRHNRVDVLPYGVDKGSSLGRWVVEENITPMHVLAFGESLGDVSLFGRGWKGVCFPHGPQEMVAEATRFHNVYVAKFDGPAGVIDGLRHHGWVAVASTV